MEKIKTTHKGVEIEYDEESSLWRYVVNGRERESPTLTAARKAIEAAPKGKPFKPIKAYLRRYDGFKIVEITSFCTKNSRYGGVSAWVRTDKNARSKELVDRLYSLSPENETRIKLIQNASEEIDKLRDTIDTLVDQMNTVSIPKE